MKDKPLILADYHLIEAIYNSARTIIYRGVSEADGQAVIIKCLEKEWPTFSELVRFRHQYTVTKNLNIPGVVRPLSLYNYGKGLALVMEDQGLISLNNFWKIEKNGNFLEQFLDIAIQITKILEGLHQQRIIHKDINPSNILIHPKTRQIKLIDFSISSQLPKEYIQLQPPTILEGTLAYIAPEQTGRMNRGLDYRSDFYGLGVTFYELLTGTLPFISEDPVELVYCHLARSPIPPHQINASIPKILSNLILKLMAKLSEERYQSALGLKYDLEKIKAAKGQIRSFKLGEKDFNDYLIIPEKLYGREKEIETLLEAFKRVSEESKRIDINSLLQTKENKKNLQSSVELMLVTGFSGIGKTALVNEIHKPVLRQRGYFIKGKYDQFQRNIPFSALVQALRNWVNQLMAQTQQQLDSWKQQILEAVGENGQVLIDFIPELEKIIGKQPEALELVGTAAQNRFNLLFQKFIQVIATVDHPLVIFLDDLQWIDAASLQLFKQLMSNEEGCHLLLIGAYRDNEVSAIHPLMSIIDDMKKAGVRINKVTLNPLSKTALNHLIADALHCKKQKAQPLSQLIYQKTQGNVFFATQLLKSFYEDGMIQFNITQRGWECNLAQIQQLTTSDNVVEFMAKQLEKLPEATQNILKLAACIGNQFELQTLSIIYEQTKEETANDLWIALEKGLILPTTDIYKFYQNRENITQELDYSLEANKTPVSTYKFRHDRIQQAAYYLISEAEIEIFHYHIGQLLLKQSSEIEKEENIFEIVNQLNYGINLITTQSERDSLAQLNLTACRKAQAATAYQTAYEYAVKGLSLLGKETWQHQYEMTLAFHELAAETASLCGNFEQMNYLIETVLNHVTNPLDQVQSYQIKIQALNSLGEFVKGIAIGKSVLELFGVNLPDNPTLEDITQARQKITNLIGDRNVADLVDLPKMTDPQKLAIMQISTSIAPSCYFTNSPIYLLISPLMVALSIQYGNSELSAHSYVDYAFQLSTTWQEMEKVEQFGQLGYRLASETNTKKYRPITFTLLGTFIKPCTTHLRESLDILEKVGLETGNLEMFGYKLQNIAANYFWCGQFLEDYEINVHKYYEQSINLNQVSPKNFCFIYWQATMLLLDKSGEKIVLNQEDYEKTIIAEASKNKDLWRLFQFYLYRLTVAFILVELPKAKQDAQRAREYLSSCIGTIMKPNFYFYDSLIALVEIEEMPEKEIQWQRIYDNQNILQKWGNYAPMNYLHKWQLVEAESHRLQNKKLETMEFYDLAIAGAKTNEYVQDEALANELAAKFYLEWGKEKIAQTYLIEAYYCYVRWGAKAKLKQLEASYPQFFDFVINSPNKSVISLNRKNTISIDNHWLDIEAILKSTQAIAQEVNLNSLLATLIKIILQNTGAQKAIFLTKKIDILQVEAIGYHNQENVKTELNLPLENYQDIPKTIINTVANTQEILTINNAIKQTQWLVDSYIISEQPKSICTVPILKQKQLIGILYLENNLISNAFTPNHFEILKHLCSQAAISLENAYLYQELEQQVEERTKQLEQSQLHYATLAEVSPVGIFHNNAEGKSTYVNQRWCELTGLTADRANDWLEVVHPDYRERLLKEWEQCVIQGNQYVIESCLLRPDNSIKWVYCQAMPEIDEQGNTVSYVGTLTDITALKQAQIQQQELFRELSNLKYAIDQSAIIAISDVQDKITYVNDRFCEISQYTREEIIGQSHRLINSGYHERSFFQELWSTISQGKIWQGEIKNQAKDGSYYWVDTVIVPFLDERGTPIQYMAIRHETTQRKQVEQELQSQKNFLQIILDHLPVSLFVKNAKEDNFGQLLLVNQACEHLFGLKATEVIGKTGHDLFPPEQAEFYEKKDREAFARGTIEDIPEEPIDSHTLGRRYVHTFKVPLYNINEQPEYLLCISEDITERKNLEIALQSLLIGTASVTGEDFFPVLVEQIAAAFQVSHVFLSQQIGDELQTVAWYADNQIQNQLSYAIRHSPCETAIKQENYYCNSRLQEKYPLDPYLTILEAESYLGVALKNQADKTIGVLCLLNRQPIANQQFAQNVLQIFAAKASAELERLQIQQDLQKLNQELEERVLQRTEDLARSEEDLRTIFNNVYDALFIHDLDGILLDANDRALELHGVTREQLLTTTIANLIAPDASLVSLAEYFGQVQKGETLEFEWVVRRLNDHTLFDAEIFMQPIILDNRQAILVGVRDISEKQAALRERQQTQIALQESQSFLQTVLDTFPLNVFWKDRQSVFLGCNQMFISQTNLAFPQEIIGKTDYDMPWSATEADLYCADDRQVMDSGQAKLGIIEPQLTADGSTIWIETNKLPLRNLEGEVIGILGTYQDISDRKLTEMKLQEQKEFLRSIYDGAEMPIFVIELLNENQFSYVGWNPASEKISGLQAADVLGKSPVEVMGEELGNAFCQNYRRCLEAGEAIHYEENLALPTGIVWTLTTLKPLKNSKGDIYQIVGTAVDITDRKHAEQALQESEERLRLALKSANQGLYDLNIQTGEAIVSAEYATMLGYDPATFEENNANWLERLHPDDVQRVTQVYLNYIAGIIPDYRVQFRQRTQQGKWKWILSMGKIVAWDDSGQPLRMLGTHTDISEQQEAVRERYLAQERLHAALEASETGTFRWHINTNELEWDDNLKSLFGLPIGEMVHQLDEFINLVHPDDRHTVIASFNRSFKEGIDFEQEFRVIWPDGTIHWLFDKGKIFSDKQDNSYYMAGACVDITQRKQSEFLLQEMNAQLEQRVVERTAELQKAKEMAETANQAKSSFLANISHELRTPLNGIMGYAQILQRSPQLSSEYKKNIQVIYQCGSHLLTLIEDILDISKIEAGRMELYPQEFLLSSFLQGVVAICRIKAEQKYLSFIYQPDPSLPVVINADQKRLRQVLLNLLGNAIKFTPLGSIKFRISFESFRTNDQGFLQFEIEDTGIGISPDQLDKIFLPFEQVGSIFHKAEGTGLGLSISQKILQMMGSQLMVKSTLGVGSIFSFKLPISSWIQDHKINSETFSVSPILVGYNGENKTVLVVDDIPDNRAIIVDLLQPLGFIVQEANNGQEGLTQSIKLQPNLIIVDLIMPDMDGWEMVKQLRQLPQGQDIIVIASSANVSQSDRQRSQAVGCNDFLPKPIQAQALFQQLQKHLQIQWIYESISETESTTKLIIPPVEIIDKLTDLANKGRILDIVEETQKLKEQHQEFTVFANYLNHLAEEFELEKIRQFLSKNSYDN